MTQQVYIDRAKDNVSPINFSRACSNVLGIFFATALFQAKHSIHVVVFVFFSKLYNPFIPCPGILSNQNPQDFAIFDTIYLKNCAQSIIGHQPSILVKNCIWPKVGEYFFYSALSFCFIYLTMPQLRAFKESINCWSLQAMIQKIVTSTRNLLEDCIFCISA